MDAAFMLLQHNAANELELIMMVGAVPDAMKPDSHGVRTRWNRGFMAFQQVWRSQNMMLMVQV
jgi:hypothetical protein